MASDNNDEERQQFVDRMMAREGQVRPLSDEEVLALRRMKDEYEKAAWLKKKIFVWAPWLIGIIVAGSAGWSWLVSYIKGH